MKHSLEVDHWKITSKLWSNKCLKLQIPVFNICVNLSAQLFEKGYRRNLKCHFGAFNTQCKFGVKLEPLTKMLVGFSFFDENG